MARLSGVNDLRVLYSVKSMSCLTKVELKKREASDEVSGLETIY